ncbi:MAG: AAA family ATPase [Phycisphaerae bacterium]
MMLQPRTDSTPDIAVSIADFTQQVSTIERELTKVIVGHTVVVRQTLLCLLTGGHALLEGVPGLGKTLLVKTLGQILDLKFSRIQFTPDLMPADIIGTSILVSDAGGNRSLTFQPGPIFGNLILADEINRATPKTQSALLEAMAEQSVTVNKTTHAMADPFFVLATQNPLEMEGTYPLPEAQLDRFAMKIALELPALGDLAEILKRTTGSATPATLTLLNGDTIDRMKRLVRAVPASEAVNSYIARLILASHPQSPTAPHLVKQYVRYGSSPRGGQSILLAAKAVALINGRTNVAFEDIAEVVRPALRHRLLLNFDAQNDSVTAENVLDDLLNHVHP